MIEWIYREMAIAYYRWALHDIDPTHRDVPHIVRRLHTLLEQRGPGRPGVFIHRTRPPIWRRALRAFWGWC